MQGLPGLVTSHVPPLVRVGERREKLEKEVPGRRRAPPCHRPGPRRAAVEALRLGDDGLFAVWETPVSAVGAPVTATTLVAGRGHLRGL